MEQKNVLTTCAIANRYWYEGADGIYAFNWHSNGADFRRTLLETVGELPAPPYRCLANLSVD